jgi:hypothetical protein
LTVTWRDWDTMTLSAAGVTVTVGVASVTVTAAAVPEALLYDEELAVSGE